jgi:NTP pyrophosphatase (non-canonical NTP hydrolase)
MTVSKISFYNNIVGIQIEMSSIAIEYYNSKFGDDKAAAFIHLVREIGEIAFAMEKNNTEHAKLEITESVALLYYLASKYELDLDANIRSLYTKKLEMLKTPGRSQ